MKISNVLLFAMLTIGFQSQAIEPTGRIGVVNKADGTASFISLENGNAEITVHVGYFPHEITGSIDGTKAFVTNYGKDHVRSTSQLNRPGNTFSVINLNGTANVTDIPLTPTPCAPHGIVASKDGARLYLTCEDRQEIVVVDISTKQVLYSIPTNQDQSHVLVVSTDETRAYVANFGPGTITVLDLKNKNIIKQITAGPGTEGIALSANQDFIFATSVLTNTLFKIDSKTLEIVQQAKTDRSPIRVGATPDGKYILVNNSADGTMQVFDPATLVLVKRIKVGTQPIGLAVPDNNFAYSANMRDNTISVVDLQKLEVTKVVPTGHRPDGISYFR